MILLDIVMPGMDGYEVCRRLKADDGTRHIPVVFLTALRTDRESRIRALEAGAEGFLAKPLEEVELTAQIRAMAKIKAANVQARHEKEHLAALVAERTAELELELTERKRAEAALQESNELLSLFVEHSPIFAFIKEVTPTESRVLKASENYLDMIGVPGSEMVGKTMAELFPAEFAAEISADDWAVVSDGKTLKLDEDFNGRNYTTIKFPIFQEGKHLLAGYSIDVTERNRVEAALQMNEQKSQQIIAQATDGIAIADEEGLVIEWNNRQEEITGIAKSEVLGKPIWEAQYRIALPEAQTPEGLAQLQGFVSSILQTRESDFFNQTVEREICRADGAIRSIEAIAYPIRFNHSFLVGSITRDITERKRTEAALSRHAEQLAALHETLLGITAQQALPLLLQSIVERAAGLLQADAGGLYLCDPEKRQCRCEVSYRTPQDYTGTLLKYGDGAAGTVAQTGQPLMVDDYRTWSGRAVVFEKDRPFQALIAMPIIWREQVTGVIDVLRQGTRPFTKADQDLLGRFAAHAAIAIEDARLLQSLQHELTERQRTTDALRKAREALEESERLKSEVIEKLNEAQEVAKVGSWDWDLESNEVWWSAETYRLFGVQPQEYTPGFESNARFIHPDDLELYRSAFARSLETGEALDFDLRIVAGDGVTRYCRALGRCSYSEPGGPKRFIGTVMDITERKRTEDALQESERHFRHIANTISDIAYSCLAYADSSYVIDWMTGAIEQITGYAAAEITARRCWRFLVTEEDLGLYEAHIIGLTPGASASCELRLRRKDGEIVWVSSFAECVQQDERHPNCRRLYGGLVDITEQKTRGDGVTRA